MVISFIDSTAIRACHIKRAKQHKTLKDWAQSARSSLGWFYGFKLHIVINDKGELLAFKISPGNTDDRAPLSDETFIHRLWGKLVGDRAYIGQDLFEQLFVDDIHLVTKRKKI